MLRFSPTPDIDASRHGSLLFCLAWRERCRLPRDTLE
jgi:hypothetical protein